MQTVIGASIHCGWTELVAVGADTNEPRVLDRWRVVLDRPGEPRSPYLPPTLTEVLASRAATCAADGMMYRETFADCAADLEILVVRYSRKVDVIEMAAEALGVDGCRLGTAIKRLGASVGAPWRKEHRYAAAAAIMVLGGLVGRGNLRLTA